MAIYHDFEYFRPTSINEALTLKLKFGINASLLNGATDLAVKLKESAEAPAALINIKEIPELKKLEIVNDVLHIGACVTFTDLIASKIVNQYFPIISEAAATVASVGTRNRATIVGNICSAVPSLDSGPALLLHEAVVVLKSTNGERKVKISDWFTGVKKTAIKENEMVTSLEIPVIKEKIGTCYMKHGRYKGEDLAQAGVGILITDKKECRVAFCAVGPIPKRSQRIETLLTGKEISESLIEEIKKIIPEEISPITDIRSSKEYRVHMTQVMFERSMKKAIERLKK